MKKLFLMFSSVLLVGVCIYFLYVNYFTSSIIYQVIGEEEGIELKEGLLETTEIVSIELCFSDETLPFDKIENCYYLPLSMEKTSWEKGELKSGQEGVELYFLEDFLEKDKKALMEEGKKIPFLAVQNGTYQEAYLVITGLPVIGIGTIADADAGEFGGSVYFWDASKKQDWKTSSILEGRIRGNTSKEYEKKGYRLELKTLNKEGEIIEDKRSVFGMRSDDEWILNAMYSDSSKLRDKLSWDIWKEIGAKQEEYKDAYFGTNFQYVEVFFNDEYWGLYGLIEPIDSKQLDLTKEAEGGITEYAYKASNGQELGTKGLLETEIFQEEMDGYELKGSYETIGKEEWQAFFDFLACRDLTTDEEFKEGAPELMDIEGALDVWIYLQTVLGIDNRGKNMYYVAKSDGENSRIYFAPWDMDLTFGDALSAGTDGRLWDVGILEDLYTERINWSLGDRLIELDVAGAKSFVYDRYPELREGVLSEESLRKLIDTNIELIEGSGARNRDELRWPESNTGADYEAFKESTLYRMDILDQYLIDDIDGYLELDYE